MSTSALKNRDWVKSWVVNYLGQLRLYSYADLLLLLWALHATLREGIVCSLLWFGFLIHLEWRHRDVGRRLWPWPAWMIPWAVAVVLAPTIKLVAFFGMAVSYSLKKRLTYFGIISSVLNGGLKASLVLTLSVVNLNAVTTVFIVMTVRNLFGDVRDAEKDAKEGVYSLPVAVGYQRATPFIYPTGLAASSLLWTVIGELPVWALGATWTIQALTYRLTPR